jgi:adenine-specific DNA-methyltransferase
MLLLDNQQKEERDISLMDTVDCFRLDANRKIDPSTRSKFGQYMTNAPVANFMASLFVNMSGKIRLLDAGAGVGSLTAAFVQEACNRQEKPDTINAEIYEIEPIFSDYLKETLSECNNLCALNNIPSDFILRLFKRNIVRM